MSLLEEAAAANLTRIANIPDSFKAGLSQRRKDLQANTTFDMPVPGYDDLALWVRYRVLGFEDLKAIGLEIESETSDQTLGERLTASQTLVAACEDLLHYKGRDSQSKPILASLGYQWGLSAARDLFEVELPEGVADREALLEIFPYPRDMLLVTHFNDYVEMGMSYLPSIDEVIQGESRAAPAATS